MTSPSTSATVSEAPAPAARRRTSPPRPTVNTAIGWLLSFLPRRWLQQALREQWTASLTRGDAIRFDYWGATGNPEHHAFAWADTLPQTTEEPTRADV